jgi:hypothetical protein
MTRPAILDVAREQVLEGGEGLDEAQVLEVLRLPDDALDEALALAHEVRVRWCGPDVEVPGGLSLLLAVGTLRHAGPRRPAGHPVAGRGSTPDRCVGGDRVLHRRRRPRAR